MKLRALPQFQSDSQTLNLLQTQWGSILGPVIRHPLLNGTTLQNVVLQAGDNVINHGLQRPLQGWFVVRQRGAGTFYDLQDTNVSPELTLLLNSSANVSVNLYVY